MVHPCELLKLTGQPSFLGQAPTREKPLQVLDKMFYFQSS